MGLYQGAPTCASDLTDDHFCFVWEQVEKKFIPWGPNSALNLLHPPVTQDEILHLRAEIKELKEKVQELEGLKEKVQEL